MEGHEFFRPSGVWLSRLALVLGVLVGTAAHVGAQRSHNGPVDALAFSSTGAYLISGSRDGSAKVWNVSDGSIVSIVGAPDEVLALGFAGPNRLASVSRKGTIRLWQTDTGTLMLSRQAGLGVQQVAFSPNRRWLALGRSSGRVTLVALPNLELALEIDAHELAVTALAFSPDSGSLAAGAADQTLRIFDVGNGNQKSIFEGLPANVRTLVFAPDGELIAGTEADEGGDGFLVYPDRVTRQGMETKVAHRGDVADLAFRSDGLLASIGSDGVIRIWTQGGFVQNRLRGHQATIGQLAWQGNTLVSASHDRTLRFWDPDEEEAERTIAAHLGPVSALAVSPAGTIATGSLAALDEQTLRIWTANRSPLMSLQTAAGPIAQVCVSAEADLIGLITEAGVVQVWDSESRLLLGQLATPENPARHIEFDRREPRLLIQRARTWTSWDWRTSSDEPASPLREAEAATVVATTSKDAANIELAQRPDGSIEVILPSSVTAESLVLSQDKQTVAIGLRNGVIEVLRIDSPSSSRMALVDMATVVFDLEASPVGMFRVDRAPLGMIRLVASNTCGSLSDGRCVSRSGGILLNFTGPVFSGSGQLTENVGGILVEASRPGLIQPLGHVVGPKAAAIFLADGIDLEAGDSVTLSGLELTTAPTRIGRGRYPRDGAPDLLLDLLKYDELLAPVRVVAYPRPQPTVFLDKRSGIAAVPAQPARFGPESRPVGVLVDSEKLVGPVRSFGPLEDVAEALLVLDAGSTVVTAGQDRRVTAFNVDTGEVVAAGTGHVDWIQAMAWDPGQRQIYTADWDGVIRQWDSEGLHLRGEWTAHRSGINALAVLTKHRLLISGGEDEQLIFWDLKDHSPLRQVSTQSWVAALAPSDQKGEIAAGLGSGAVEIWTLDGKLDRILEGSEGAVHTVRYSANGQFVAAGGEDGKVRLWQMRPPGSRLRPIRQPADEVLDQANSVRTLCISNDGRFVAVGGWDGTIRLWNLPEATLKQHFRGHPRGVTSLGFSSDGRLLFSTGWDRMVHVWELEDE